MISAISAIGEAELIKQESSLLSNFQAVGFSDFINDNKVWDKMEDFVIHYIPNVLDRLPKHPLSTDELHARLSSLESIKKQQAKLQAENDKGKEMTKKAEAKH